MSTKIFEHIKTYGLSNGIQLYINRKLKKTSVVKFPFLTYPVEIRGQKTRSDLTMFDQIFYSKEYDVHVPINPTIIVDLGANVGFGSIYFANRFPNSSIFSLEPNVENYAVACNNVKHYRNIKMVYGAIWNTSEEIHVVDKGFGEASFIIEQGAGANNIQAYTIKKVMDTMKTEYIDILKIDIEGSEKEIFETGFEDWLPFSKIIIIETHDRFKKGSSKAVLNAISSYNFSLEISGENLVFYNNNLINTY